MIEKANGNTAATKRAVFMIGGPGAGKSFIRTRRYSDLPVLDCDAIKATHPDYDPKNPQALHTWSAAELHRQYFATIAAGTDFAYDGTGSNAERYVNYIRAAQQMGYTVEICYVTVPLPVALKRNAERARTVPEDVVREKHSLIGTSFEIIAPHADTVTVIQNG